LPELIPVEVKLILEDDGVGCRNPVPFNMKGCNK